MKNTIEKVLLAGLMGGIALGAAAYHAIQIYLAETDAQDPVKAEPASESAADGMAENEAAPESAADDMAENEAAPESAADGIAENEPAPESAAADESMSASDAANDQE